MNIAAYCRVSTDKADQLNSLETQKRFFAEYAERTGHTLVRLYADEGLSGTKVKHRGAFRQMMADAERGAFEQLVVKDISRLARNTVDLLQSVRRLKALGIQTRFLTASMDSMGDSEFILTVFAGLAQEESANISKRVKFGKRVNAERGKVPNLVYGYDKTAGDYFRLTVNREEAAVVREIYDLYTQEGFGAGKIAAALNRRGLRTKRGKAWSQNGVSRILANPLYTGKVVNGRQEVSDFLTSARTDRPREDWLITERPELRIVSDERFRQAEALRESRNRMFRQQHRRQSSQYLFSTLIRCGECGWSFRRVSRTYQNTYVRWVCARRNGQGADQCENAVSLEENELIDRLDQYFRALIPDGKKAARLFRQKLRQSLAEDPSERKALEERLGRLEGKRRKYLNLYAEDLITRRELEERLSATREEAERLEGRLEALAPSGPGAVDALAEGMLQDPARFLTVRNLNNGQLKRLVERIEADKNGDVVVRLRTEDSGDGTI